MLDKRSIKHIHCIGIGGIGVGGIAEYLLRQGFKVTGSDCRRNKVIDDLEALGATIFVGHDPEHIADADVVVYSSAIKADNPEFIAAKKSGVHLLQRAEMLAELMHDAKGIAIAGTHGKTTTTSLTAALLLNGGFDPSFMIGGRIRDLSGPARLGQGDYFVVEADESDASFLNFRPEIAVVNNIEADHMGTYEDSFAKLEQSFLDFLALLPDHGVAVLGVDDPVVAKLRRQVKAHSISFGFSPNADYRIENFSQQGLRSYFTLNMPAQQKMVVELNLPGKHNALNAAAAIAIANHVGVAEVSMLETLANFSGVGRRFHQVGFMPLQSGGQVTIVDDYGHHPGAIKVTLEAAKMAWPEQRIVLVFQPHRYSRTHDLFDDFVDSLSAADVVILPDVFAAGEAHISGADSQHLAEQIKAKGHEQVFYVPELKDMASCLQQITQADDVVILQGAGDIGALPQQLVES